MLKFKKQNKVRKGIISLIFLFMIGACTKNEIVDPFWDIDFDTDISYINNFLYQESNRGNIVDCVFSFDKKTYIKKNDFDAKVNLSLDYPKTVNDQLRIDYSLVAEFKNEEEQQFNQAFYKYFLNLMKSGYGNNFQKETDKNLIHLHWDDEYKISLKVTVIKDINRYMVSVVKEK